MKPVKPRRASSVRSALTRGALAAPSGASSNDWNWASNMSGTLLATRPGGNGSRRGLWALAKFLGAGLVPAVLTGPDGRTQGSPLLTNRSHWVMHTTWPLALAAEGAGRRPQHQRHPALERDAVRQHQPARPIDRERGAPLRGQKAGQHHVAMRRREPCHRGRHPDERREEDIGEDEIERPARAKPARPQAIGANDLDRRTCPVEPAHCRARPQPHGRRCRSPAPVAAAPAPPRWRGRRCRCRDRARARSRGRAGASPAGRARRGSRGWCRDGRCRTPAPPRSRCRCDLAARGRGHGRHARGNARPRPASALAGSPAPNRSPRWSRTPAHWRSAARPRARSRRVPPSRWGPRENAAKPSTAHPACSDAAITTSAESKLSASASRIRRASASLVERRAQKLVSVVLMVETVRLLRFAAGTDIPVHHSGAAALTDPAHAQSLETQSTSNSTGLCTGFTTKLSTVNRHAAACRVGPNRGLVSVARHRIVNSQSGREVE